MPVAAPLAGLPKRHALSIAADVGGTFTDVTLIAPNGRILTHKLPSTPHDYADAIVEGIEEICRANGIGAADLATVLHACTVATNAILERKGARVALVTTRGFRDVLEFRRIRVPKLYDPLWRKPAPLVSRQMRLEVTERIGSRGEIVQPIDHGELDKVVETLRLLEVEAIAVCLINSYANPAHEMEIGHRLREEFPAAFITVSSELLPEIREYERTSTTVVNSYVGPVMQRYVRSLGGRLKQASVTGRLMIMQSSGGVLDAETVAKEPARVIECGPAAGVIAALELGKALGIDNLITLDMGGTTAKASLIEGGRLTTTDEYEIGGGISLSSQLVKGGGYALKTPVIDISEVGAGGGSIVRLDKAGQMKVGPDSAGAVPGPVCYGRGGDEPTVTDANLVLGYLNPSAIGGGAVAVDINLARSAIAERIAGPIGKDLRETAFGIHTLANASMMRAVRSVSTNRGRDPAGFTLMAFGGNGGIHGISLARDLGIATVIVPAAAGVFSALGLLVTDIAMTKTQAFLRRLDLIQPDELEQTLAELKRRIRAGLDQAPESVEFRHRASMRYVGQAFELSVDIDMELFRSGGPAMLGEAFESEHERTYGHRFPGRRRIQIVSLAVTGVVPTNGRDALLREQPGAPAADLPPASRPVYFGDAFGLLDTPVVSRGEMGRRTWRGPLIIEDADSTSVIPPDAQVSVDPHGHLIVRLDATAMERPADASRH